MIPNNNFSVLPWYTSLDQQNARRWWIYDRVYPLFTPATFLLPFQLMREHETTETYTKGAEISGDEFYQDVFIANSGDRIDLVAAGESTGVWNFDVDGESAVYLENVPQAGGNYYNICFAQSDGRIISGGDYTLDGLDYFTGYLSVPEGATRLYVLIDRASSEYVGLVCSAEVSTVTTPVTSFEIYTRDGELVGSYPSVRDAIEIVTFDGYDYLVYAGLFPFTASFENGQYYAVLVSGERTWYSEVFTVVNDIAPYLKIVWWDNEDFVMDAGRIVYRNPNFKNVLYLDAQIAKPEYVFEEEGESRDGYFFPTKQISEKRYRFAFLASEYLLDVMRFIRMADFAYIESNGQRYSLDTFLITPEWESNGDVAAVSAEFDTATVAKKIGVGYVKNLRGDFNDDFNNDFDND